MLLRPAPPLCYARYSVGWLLLLSAACKGEPPDLPPIVAQLPRVEYRSDTDLTLCPRAPELVQEQIERLERLLGIRGPERIHYVHIANNDRRAKVLDWHGCVSQGGCAIGSEVVVRDRVNQHEIVHAVLSPLGRPNPLLEEGLATAFGLQDNPYDYSDVAWRDLLHLIPGDEKFWQTYKAGAKLLASLFEEHGPEPVVEFYRRATWGQSSENFAALFEELFGEDLDAAWERTQSLPSWSVCAGIEPNVNLKGGEALTSDSQCAGYGPPLQHAWKLEEDTPLAISSTYQTLLFGSCKLDQAPPYPGLFNTDDQLIVEVATWPAGFYYANGRGNGNNSLRMQRGRFLGSRCSDVEPLPLDTAPASLGISMIPFVPPYER